MFIDISPMDPMRWISANDEGSSSHGGGKSTGKVPKEVMFPSGIGWNKPDSFSQPQTSNEGKGGRASVMRCVLGLRKEDWP